MIGNSNSQTVDLRMHDKRNFFSYFNTYYTDLKYGGLLLGHYFTSTASKFEALIPYS